MASGRGNYKPKRGNKSKVLNLKLLHPFAVTSLKNAKVNKCVGEKRGKNPKTPKHLEYFVVIIKKILTLN